MAKGRGGYHVEDPDYRRVTRISAPLDRAAAEQRAMSESRRTPGVWRVVPEGDSKPVARFEDGKQVRG